MSRLGPSVDGALTTLAVIGVGVVTLSVVALQSPVATTVNDQAGPAQNVSAPTVDNAGQPQPQATLPNGQPAPTRPGNRPAAQGTAGPALGQGGCTKANNGGKTDRGVTATSIKLGATVVQSGLGQSFLGSVSTALNAVKNEVNHSGGICGRNLDLTLVDDGWDPVLGYQYIQNLVEDKKVFALAVAPSSEGVRNASLAHYFSKTETPVVGSDGMLNTQYTDPWIWPVAASTVSTMHIMAYDACTRLRKQQFSIVFDSTYHFGIEGAYAFNAAVKRCTGHDIPGYFDPTGSGGCTARFCAIAAGKSNYDTEHKSWNDACFGGAGGGKCDFVAYLLEPNEAAAFLGQGAQLITARGLAQTLFSRDFASSCGSACDGALVWTGYNPNAEQFAALPAVKKYVATIHSQDPNADVLNQFLEGGYAGMQLLVDALRRLGPNVTRRGLAALLDQTKFDGGLTTPLVWQPGKHFANSAMQAFSINSKGGFNGFRSITGWVRDPYLGQDVK
jgi:ABC-type branched-subunit amino acid transport system substrate-binding protein